MKDNPRITCLDGVIVMKLLTGHKEIKFKQVQLFFTEGSQENIFANMNNRTLSETIRNARYIKFKTIVDSKYSEFLNMNLGSFLLVLKQKMIRFI